MTTSASWNNRNCSSHYGSLVPVFAAASNNHSDDDDDDDDDERQKLMGHCSHDHHHHHHHPADHGANHSSWPRTTRTTPLKKTNDTTKGNNKRLIAFLSVLTALSVVTTSTLLVLHLGSGGDLDDDGSYSPQPWGLSWFHGRSAQQVADEALEALNNKRLLLQEEEEEKETNNVGGSGSGRGIATNLAAQLDVNNIIPPSDTTTTLPLLNLHREDSSSKLEAGCEGTVVIVRHCEKASIREHCAYIGYERSVYLATLFGDDHHSRWPAPSYIFALAPGGRNNKSKLNFREIETAGPLAKKSGVQVNYAYDQEDDRPLAKHVHELLHSGALCGKVAFIAWKHSRIGHLAHLLGCGPKQHCPMDFKGTTFDPAWTIQFSYRHLWHSEHKGLKVPQHPEWHVAGSVQYENFDPLAFSKQSGDYPRGGRSRGAGWEDRAEMIPERKKSTSSKTWIRDEFAKKPDFLGVGPSDVDVKAAAADDDDDNNGWRQ